MKIAIWLLCSAVIYTMLVHLLAVAVGAPPGDTSCGPFWPLCLVWVWHTWIVTLALTLLLPAFDLAMLVMWFVYWCVALASKMAGRRIPQAVPLQLSKADLVSLESNASIRRSIIVIPCNNEVTCGHDLEAFVSNLLSLVAYSPWFMKVVVLFDSPHSQEDNELAAIARLRRQIAEMRCHPPATLLNCFSREELDRKLDLRRIDFRTYRDKTRVERNKSGSLRRYFVTDCDGKNATWAFFCDADSMFLRPDSRFAQTVRPLERLLWAASRDETLAMIQTSISICDAETAWGEQQIVNQRIALQFHDRLCPWLFDDQATCYGHNCLIRVSDWVAHCRDTLLQVSHDHVDAAQLIAAGRRCVAAPTVWSCEGAEPSLAGFLKRSARWARGNCLWILFMLFCPRLKTGPAAFLSVGISQYLVPALALPAMLACLILLSAHVSLMPAADLSAKCLLGLVAIAIFGQKIVGGLTLKELAISTAMGFLLAPSISLLEGLFLLCAPFGEGWVPRKSRSQGLTWEHVDRLLVLFGLPAAIGALCWMLIDDQIGWQFPYFLVRFTLLSLIMSPFTAILVSFQWCPPVPATATTAPAAIVHGGAAATIPTGLGPGSQSPQQRLSQMATEQPAG